MHAVVSSWNSYLEFFHEKDRDIYFTEEYVKLYETPGDRAECFIYREGDTLFLFPYLKRRIALLDETFYDFETAYGYGGPIVNGSDAGFMERACRAFLDVLKERRVVAGFIRFNPLLCNHRFIDDRRCAVAFDRKTAGVDLTIDRDELWNRHLHPAHRNSLRKAEKNGLTFLIDEKLAYLDDFCGLYSKTMTELQADRFYHFDHDYFTRIRNSLGKSAFLGLVLLKDTIIAASLFLTSSARGHYHLSGSLREYRPLAPNNLLLFNTIVHLQKIGLTFFHLGGGSDSDPANALYTFKKRFSTHQFDYYVGRLTVDQEIYGKACEAWERRAPAQRPPPGYFLKYRQGEET
jgi:hypothetical protein